MTDLEITRLCAEAAKITFRQDSDREGQFIRIVRYAEDLNGGTFDPLHDDAQAMELVKQFVLESFRPGRRSGFEMVDDYWLVGYDSGVQVIDAKNADLNRAICECVAKFQAGKQERTR